MSEINADKQQAFALDVVRQLRAAGYEAFWAGGCVRDHLMGRSPKDYDVATSAVPEEIQNLFGRSRKTLALGRGFRRDRRGWTARRGPDRGRHVPRGCKLQRWTPPGCRSFYQRARRRVTPRLQHQRNVLRSGYEEGAGLRRRSGRPAPGYRSSDWQSARALHRRQIAVAACREVRGFLRFFD